MQNTHNITTTPQNIFQQSSIYYIFICFFLSIIILISIFIFTFAFSHIVNILWEKVFWMIMTLFWIISLASACIYWMMFESNFLIVTDKKILAFKCNTFLSQECIEIDFTRIQEIQSRTIGILPTIFHYGEITIQTATGSEKITYKYIKNPQETLKKIQQIIQKNQDIS